MTNVSIFITTAILIEQIKKFIDNFTKNTKFKKSNKPVHAPTYAVPAGSGIIHSKDGLMHRAGIHRLRARGPLSVAIALTAFAAASVPECAAQLSERPGNSASVSETKDLTGLSIKIPRVRAMHTTDPALPGGSAYFQKADPWLGFMRGKLLSQREFRPRDGVFGNEVAGFGGVLPDGFTPKITANDQVSCGGCHNIPYREAGGGVNFAKSGGDGRNTPHFYGGGLMEMLAWDIRLKMLAQMDFNRDGWVSLAEMDGSIVEAVPEEGAQPVDFGRNIDADNDGKPDLNSIFQYWFVDGKGQRLKNAKSLHDENVAGYNFSMVVFGWGEPENGINPTLRAFYWDPIHSHTGMQACDPTSYEDSNRDGLTAISNPGAQQFATHQPLDKADRMNAAGISLDDPDGDGYMNEISEGDLDLVEWYMLNAPRPGTGRQTEETRRGKALLETFGCVECHTPNWTLEPFNPEPEDYTTAFPGDRRFFDFTAAWNPAAERMEGLLTLLYREEDGLKIPKRDSFAVEGIYTDFKQHDVGEAFYQILYDGSVQKMWRTAPLWGVGSGFPWGHDGRDTTLDGNIRRHGGEAQASRDLYVSASDADREAVLAFLESLQLYHTDMVPADINGDGTIDDHFIAAGKDTGIERLNPEWLFNTPLEIEGMVTGGGGDWVRSFAGLNIAEAYGVNLEYIADNDLDGFPNLLDIAPDQTGYADGETSVPPADPENAVAGFKYF